MAVKNHNFRFNTEKDNEIRAWEILHSKEVEEDFHSQNEFVIAAINDYYNRHLAKKQDPYLESREKEDVFVKRIVEAVEQKTLDNLPGLAAMYMVQQQSLLSVMGMQGNMPAKQQMQVQMSQMMGMQSLEQIASPMQEVKQEQTVTGSKAVSGNMDYTEEDVKKYQMDLDINELLDFSFCGE